MALPKAPGPLSQSEIETLREKFAEHEVPEEQRERQEQFRAKLNASDE